MTLFENVIEINANENQLNFGIYPPYFFLIFSNRYNLFLHFYFPKESFKCFSNLNKLYLACNNLKSIRVKHEEFLNLEVSS